MSLLDSRPLPAVDALRDEVEAVFLKNKRGETPEDKPDVIDIGWQIRKMLTFLKMKVRRREVPPAPYLILNGLETKNKSDTYIYIYIIYIYAMVHACQFILLPYRSSCLKGDGLGWGLCHFPIQGAGVSANVLDVESRTPGLGLYSV